jgi:FADH2 O2-dependent halogenase
MKAIKSPGNARTADPAEKYDVAILGGTLSAGLLGAVLSRQGVRVLIIRGADDDGAPSGETTVPYTAEVFLLLAKRFEVPEISAFSLFPELPREVRADSGVKKSLGFLDHRPGQPQDSRETVQFNVPNEHGEWHLYRPTVDRYTRELAARYGAALAPDDVYVADAWTDDDLGHVRATDGHVYRASYLVDCTGPDSPLLRRHGGDDPEPRLAHRSRVYATRMRGVAPTEELLPPSRQDKVTPWSHGTVHHLFDGGWVQLVRFDNHKDGRNPVTSVTLSVDPDEFGDLPDDPDKALRAVVERYPDLARQLEGATPVCPWTVAPLYQRTAATTHGERWFALERTAARNDMFLSRDVTMATEMVHALASVLIPAVRRDNWAVSPFTRVARFQEVLGDFNDRLLRAARTASKDFPLWNAFSRVWLLWQILADLSLKRARLDAEIAGDWEPVERFELGGIWFHAPAGLREIIDRTLETVERVRAGELEPGTAAARIFADLRGEEFVPPLYAFGDPDARVYHFTLPKRLKMLWWVKTKAPADFRRLLTRDNVSGVTSASSR